MKKIVLIGIVTIILLFSSLTVYANGIGTARLSYIEGDILVSTQDTGNEWAVASINLPLMSGDRVWVPRNGRTEIQFIGKTYIRADGSTEVTITRTEWDKGTRIVQTAVSEGMVYVNNRSSAGSDSVFQVDTPLVSVMSYENSLFGINVREDGYTEVSVLSGVLYVESPRGKTRISGGNMFSIGAEDYAELSPLGPRSEWIRWNQSRDSQLAQSLSSSRYLPPELHVYSGDFDNYGKWIYVRDYGYVWNPAVMVSGWAPYRHGRWIWMRGDYVWVSYEPWGWAPYHYGRWAFRIGIGWFWVPPAVNAVFWSPGFVAWIYTPTYVSWVPLAPREIYYGYGYYGPYSLNLKNVNITNLNVTNIYVNSRVANAVTVIHRDTFLYGKKVKFDDNHYNPFAKGVRVSPGRPDIKPVKATMIPLPDKVVPRESVPSERVVEKVKTTRIRERSLAVERDYSIFKQGRQASPMPVIKSEKPKSVLADERRERDVRRIPEKVISERPRVKPIEPDGKPIDKPRGKERRIERKQIEERTFTPRLKGVEEEPRGRRGAGTSTPFQPSLK